MVEIEVNNSKSKVICSAQTLEALRELMKIKAKNYFWSPAYRRREWDGYIHYISDRTGLFDTGLLDQVCKHLRVLEKRYTIVDERETFRDIHEVKELGGGITLRSDQSKALHLILNNRIEGIKFPRGIMAEATNYGKSIIAAALFASFSQKRLGLLLVNSKTLFEQALPDLQKMLGKDQVGWVKSGSIKWLRINVCMVQTLCNLIKKNMRLRDMLAKESIVVIDEWDELVNRKDCQEILKYVYNAPIRIGLTGTEQLSKDKTRNQNQFKFCGPIIHKTTNKELVDQGVSSKPTITFLRGNQKGGMRGNWQKEYLRRIVKNRDRNDKIWKATRKRVDRGPVLILFKLHEHAIQLMDSCPEDLNKHYKIGVVHHKTANRENIIKNFNDGKVDILLASMIIRRGKNLPFIRFLINAAAGDSEVNVLQIFGRALRKTVKGKRKKVKVEMVEFFDKGYYLQRHSKHRIRYYKKQQFPVRELYKKVLVKTINNK